MNINNKFSEESVINFNETVYELTRKYPEAVEIMKKSGFENISQRNMILTAGRFMTLKKGAELKKIPLEKIKTEFESKGYKVIL